MIIHRVSNRIKNSRITHRIRHGIPDEEMKPAFDHATLPTYFCMGSFALGLTIAFALTSFRLDPKGLASPIMLFGGLILCGLAIRRYGHIKVAGTVEAIGILGLFGLLSVFAIAILSATNLPLADNILIKADSILGFSWISMMRYINDIPHLIPILAMVYGTLQWQAIALIIMTSVAGTQNELWIFINSWVISLSITGLIFPFFPAIAALNYYHLPAYASAHSADFVDWMEGIRGGAIRVIDKASVRGIVTFPSFHAAAAICFIWGFRIFPRVRGVAFILNLTMLFATLVIGGHYLVDVLGGIAIAILSIALSRRLLLNKDRTRFANPEGHMHLPS